MKSFGKLAVPASIIFFLLLLFAAITFKNGSQPPKNDDKLQQNKAAQSNTKKGENSDFSEDVTLPAFSLTTDPENLWSEEKGIYIPGKHASKKYPYKGANYWQDWGIPVDIDYIENGKSVYREAAELKIFGGETRTLPQRSFGITAKGIYGNKTFDYPFFPEKAFSEYNSFVLRNGGQDFAKTHMLDGLVSTLIQETAIDYQAYRPVVVFLNSKYWGLYDLREKIDDDFLAANHGVKKKDIDLLEANALEKEGSNKDYLALIDFIKNHDLQDDQNYLQAAEQIDIENFIDYVITELYIANTDWPSHNIRFWHAKGSYHKWRWIVYDSDLSFENYQENTVERMLKFKGKGDGSLYISFLFREFMKNQQFRTEFMNLVDYHLTHTFQSDRVIETINTLSKSIEPEMPNHLKKWGGTMADWKQNVNKLVIFAEQRPAYLKKDIKVMVDTFQ
jgi:hypothetical protein